MNKKVFQLIIVTVIVAMPLVWIWCLNTLFELEIPYNIKTWVAMFFLALVVSPMFKKGFNR